MAAALMSGRRASSTAVRTASEANSRWSDGTARRARPASAQARRSQDRQRYPRQAQREARPLLPSPRPPPSRSEEHTSELQSLMRISYAVFCLKKKNIIDKVTPILPPSTLLLHTSIRVHLLFSY